MPFVRPSNAILVAGMPLVEELQTEGATVKPGLFVKKGGKVYVTPALKAADGGTDSAILMQSGAENADLCAAQDLKTFYVQLRDMNHFFKVYEAVVPRIKRPEAICEITGIT